VRIGAGAAFPGWAVLVGPLLGAALWAPLSWVLLMPQRRLEREQML
jgi:rod shape-determining protein MreD